MNASEWALLQEVEEVVLCVENREKKPDEIKSYIIGKRIWNSTWASQLENNDL